jgi:hypothetical protein
MKVTYHCDQCKQNAERSPAGGLYVEWSQENVEDPAIRAELMRNGCIGEMFCSWGCAARWFCTQAGQDLHSQQ